VFVILNLLFLKNVNSHSIVLGHGAKRVFNSQSPATLFALIGCIVGALITVHVNQKSLPVELTINGVSGTAFVCLGSPTLTVRRRPGPPSGTVRGLPRSRDERGRQGVVRPLLSFLLVGQLYKMTGRDAKMLSVLVLELRGRQSLRRTTCAMM